MNKIIITNNNNYGTQYLLSQTLPHIISFNSHSFFMKLVLLCFVNKKQKVRCINNLHMAINNGAVTQIQPYQSLEFMLLNTIFSSLSQLNRLAVPVQTISMNTCPTFTAELNVNLTHKSQTSAFSAKASKKQPSSWLPLSSQGPQRHRISPACWHRNGPMLHISSGIEQGSLLSSGLCTGVPQGLIHAIPKFSEGTIRT